MVIDASPVHDILFWHWWLAAVALFAIEFFSPGLLFFWLGMGAVAAGFATLFYGEMGWRGESMVFAVVSMAGAVVGKDWWEKTRSRLLKKDGAASQGDGQG